MNKFLSSLSVLVVACVTTLSVHAQESKGDAKKGEAKVSMCTGCHGIVGYQASFPEIHKVPMISGQGAGYIASALAAYQKGERKHPTMRGIADSLTEKDIADVAAYYAASGAGVAAAPAKTSQASPKVTELLAKGACVSCHGEGLNQPIDPSYPKIAGQHSDYLLVALKAYKADGGALVGRGNAIMGGIAKQFTNAELKELAVYVSGLPGELKVVPQNRFK